MHVAMLSITSEFCFQILNFPISIARKRIRQRRYRQWNIVIFLFRCCMRFLAAEAFNNFCDFPLSVFCLPNELQVR